MWKNVFSSNFKLQGVFIFKRDITNKDTQLVQNLLSSPRAERDDA